MLYYYYIQWSSKPECRSGAPSFEKKALRGYSLPKIAPEHAFRGPKSHIFTFLLKSCW